jgi:hypothetical protein
MPIPKLPDFGQSEVDLTDAYQLSEVAGYVGALLIIEDTCKQLQDNLKLHDHMPREQDRVPRVIARRIISHDLIPFLAHAAHMPADDFENSIPAEAGLFNKYAAFAVAYRENNPSAEKTALQNVGFDQAMPSVRHLAAQLQPKYEAKIYDYGLHVLVPTILGAQGDCATWSLSTATEIVQQRTAANR